MLLVRGDDYDGQSDGVLMMGNKNETEEEEAEGERKRD